MIDSIALARLPPESPPQAVEAKIAAMKAIARAKVHDAGGSQAFFREVEFKLDAIAYGKLARMSPIHENLLGLALILMEQVKIGLGIADTIKPTRCSK